MRGTNLRIQEVNDRGADHNARHIVLCVNAHDRLVAALRHAARQDLAPDVLQARAAKLLAELGEDYVQESIDHE